MCIMKIFVFTSLLTVLTTSAVRSKRFWNPWPEGDYCIIMGSQGICPPGFTAGSIALAVPIEVNVMHKTLEEINQNPQQEDLVELGQIGGINLSARYYDNVYQLKISACCQKAENLN
ncbi:hypothetical protein L596_000115 [Steinernema carpocapsae]|uniref:Uncharacterized protein n=1 Tax=Steinernema carpocapsae TaxID=34508 RepID=A0A4U8ULD2_STECR|nr:hypothetical protein L596_000115 [Steinernema carpocapsae]